MQKHWNLRLSSQPLFAYFFSAQIWTRLTSVSVVFSRPLRELNSSLPWKLWPPVNRFGVGRPAGGQVRAVGAAADRADLGCHAGPLRGLDGVVGQLRIVLQHLFHVQVAELRSRSRSSRPDIASACRRRSSSAASSFAARPLISKSRSRILIVEVSSDISEPSTDARNPRGLRSFRAGGMRSGNPRQEIAGRVHRVDHDAFGRARMRALAVKRNGRGAGGPGLVRDVAELLRRRPCRRTSLPSLRCRICRCRRRPLRPA